MCKILFIAVSLYDSIVKLRQGSGKDRQGMAVKAKGLKATRLTIGYLKP